MATLMGMSGDLKGKTFEINEETITFGRATSNTVVISSGAVSSQHCRIFPEGGRVFIEDLHSTNGTRVNSRFIKEIRELTPNDLVQLGDTELLFKDENSQTEDPVVNINADIEISNAAIVPPEHFSNISPFGTKRQKKGNKFWLLLGLLIALAAGAFIFYLSTLSSMF
ncbi:MAG: FHA domain-containing protein [Spartobacteria bacterium]|nr:FHA domain-containing protein [Spartobacteria bacterium]